MRRSRIRFLSARRTEAAPPQQTPTQGSACGRYAFALANRENEFAQRFHFSSHPIFRGGDPMDVVERSQDQQRPRTPMPPSGENESPVARHQSVSQPSLEAGPLQMNLDMRKVA